MTTSVWLLQFQGSLNRWVVWLKENANIIHHPPHNSIKLQRASTGTCQQANQYKFLELDNCQQMDAYKLVFIDREVSLLPWWIVGELIDDNCV